MLVKIACMYTSYCLSFFITKIHVLVKLSKQNHPFENNVIFPTCQNFLCKPHGYEADSTLYTFLPNSTIKVGSLLLDIIFLFLITENTFQVDVSMMNYSGFALSLEQEVVMHFVFRAPCMQNSGIVSPKNTGSFKVSQTATIKKASSKAATQNFSKVMSVYS